MRVSFISFLAALALCCTIAAPACAQQSSRVPVASQRSVEQTLLTYPEWLLVHSPAEYARYVTHQPAHGFPFLGHVGQLWEGYAAVTEEQTRKGYPVNLGYHVMIVVLAVSTTIEYSLRWAYENTFGRISWALSSRSLTAEDRYAAKIAQDYVDFIRRDPWYLYDFHAALTGLWEETPWIGDNMLRKWERRYALSTEYGIKMAYAWVIEKATRAAYDPALMNTVVESDQIPVVIPPGYDIHVLQVFSDGHALLSLPRYFGFKSAALALAEKGVSFTDIAGNNGDILVTLWLRQDQAPEEGRVLFEQRLLTMPGMRRIGLILPVPSLSAFLLRAHQKNIVVEHVHDY
jgi:hypothetical protein